MKVAVFSCSKRHKQIKQPAFKDIHDKDVDFCIDLGDSYYFPNSSRKYKDKKFKDTLVDMDYVARLQRAEKYYAKLLPNMYSVFDDHCFGHNNSGSWLPSIFKAAAKKIKLDHFSAIPKVVKTRKGIYYDVDKEGILFLFLDVRTFREKYGRIWVWGRGFIRKKATLLGDTQKQWLSKMIKGYVGKIVICSGSTINGKDGWKNYPEDLHFLKSLLAGREALFLSGDIHTNKVTKHDTFLELTSSAVGRDNKNNYMVIDFKKDKVKFYGKDKLKKVEGLFSGL